MDKSDDTTTKPVFSDKVSSTPVVHMDCTYGVLDDKAPSLLVVPGGVSRPRETNILTDVTFSESKLEEKSSSENVTLREPESSSEKSSSESVTLCEESLEKSSSETVTLCGPESLSEESDTPNGWEGETTFRLDGEEYDIVIRDGQFTTMKGVLGLPTGKTTTDYKKRPLPEYKVYLQRFASIVEKTNTLQLITPVVHDVCKKIIAILEAAPCGAKRPENLPEEDEYEGHHGILKSLGGCDTDIYWLPLTDTTRSMYYALQPLVINNRLAVLPPL